MSWDNLRESYRAVPKSQRNFGVRCVMDELYLLHTLNIRIKNGEPYMIAWALPRCNNILSEIFEQTGTSQEPFAMFPAYSEYAFGDDDYTDPEIQL